MKAKEKEAVRARIENRHVKVHLVGYDSDEWRDEKDVEIIYPVPRELQYYF